MKSKVVKTKKPVKEAKPLTSVEERIEKLADTGPAKEKTVHEEKPGAEVETKPITSVHTEVVHEKETHFKTSEKTVDRENEEKPESTEKSEKVEEKSFLSGVEDAGPVVAVEKSSFLVQVIIPLIVGIVVGLATGVSAVYLLGKNNIISKNTVSPTPTQTIEVQPTATPAGLTEADLTFYDISVLNGSGKSGEAARVEKILKDKGFTVFETGNADKSSYTKTIIKAKTEVSEKYVTELNKILSEYFTLDKTASLSADSDTDVVIIVGKEQVATTVTPVP